ncbi:ribosomal protein L7/L12 [Streptomyces sp. NPDC014684]|uniref:ribosomal protein L7/L12 n=1 Tax=Streptomyces sp. NPDC014684 TaxID=3364880 RepID=UPI0036F54F0F
MADEYFLLVCDDVPHDVVLTDSGVRVMDVVQVVRRLTELSLWHSKVLAAQVPGRVMDVVQVVRRLTGLSLWHSKVLAAQVPAVILAGVPQEDATAAVSALRGVGARAEEREQPEPGFLEH